MRDLIARTTTWTSSPPGASAKDYVAITDHLGSPIVLLRVQAGGALGFLAEPAESISYDPYGRPTVHVPFGTSLPGQPAFTAKGWLVEARGATARTGVRSIHSRVDTAWVPLTLWGPLASMSSTGWRLLFTQRDYEPGAQAYWYRLRWYDPAQGRFWSRDPLGYEPGLVQYAYCNGNPVNFVDPWGLKVTITGHGVKVGGFGDAFHAAIEIRPDRPEDFMRPDGSMDPRFKKDSEGNWYLTLSAGPDFSGKGEFPRLKSDPNRPSDAPDENFTFSEVLPPEGVCDTEFIVRLLRADVYYADDLQYRPYPDEPGEHNSNGYVSGLIGALGATLSSPWNIRSWSMFGVPEIHFPGWDSPVPAEHFVPQRK